MPPEISPLHHDLAFNAPLSDRRSGELSRFLAERAQGTVLDSGCGWAELLVRILELGPDLEGLGIDSDAELIRYGQQIGRERGVDTRLRLVVGDAGTRLPSTVGGVISIGASHIWGPTVDEMMPIDYRSALLTIRGLLKPGSPVIFGEGIWTAEPTPEAVEPLAGRLDEFVFMPELLDIVRQCGFVIIRTHQASLDEWDKFESGFTAGYARWLLEHGTDHPDAATVATRLQAQTDGYFNGYRNVLGMAYLQLLAI